jgi:hypothetical protein
MSPRRTVSTRELVACGRVERNSKYRLSVRDMDEWLGKLADQGLLMRLGNGWRLTPTGRQHFRGVELTWGREEAA